MKKLIAMISLVGILAITGVVSYAYFTDSSTLNNDFSTASLRVKIVEPEYEKLSDSDDNGIKDEAEDLHQGKRICKDPCIVNDSSVDAWLFMAVTVPVKEVMTVESAPDRAATPLFAYEYDAEKWVLMDEKETEAGTAALYAYKQVVPAGDQTTPVFTEVAYADVVEGEFPDTDILEVTVEGYGIQAEGFKDFEEAFHNYSWK